MLVKYADKTPSYLSWCPVEGRGHLLAAATRGGTLDANFESHNYLEVFDTRFDGTNGLPCVATTKHSEQTDSSVSFASVSWGHAANSETYTSGIIASGMQDGSLYLYNPEALLQKASEPVILHKQAHRRCVSSLDFNMKVPRFLASGSWDGQVFIWDLTNPTNAINQLPVKQGYEKYAKCGQVTNVAWNKVVPYILASSCQNGETHIWDLKNKKCIVTLSSSYTQAPRKIMWHPENARELCICYANNTAEIWDLSYAHSPKAYLENGHQRMILDMDWCPHDANMLLTTGEDCKAIIWDPSVKREDSGYDIKIHEMQFKEPASISVWNPSKPGVIATCSKTGKIGVRNLQYCGDKHVPKWLRKTSGASFGFGSKLITFGKENKLLGADKLPTNPKLQMYKLQSDPEIGEKAQVIAEMLKKDDQNSLKEFTARKAQAAVGSETSDKTIWELINLFYTQSDKKSEILKHFGFKLDTASSDKKAEILTSTNHLGKAKKQTQIENDDEFFNRLGSTSELSDETGLVAETLLEDKEKEEEKQAPPTSAISGVGKLDQSVRDALVTKNFKLAVSISLQQKRVADALVFAKYGPPGLWEETAKNYLSQHDDPFVSNLFCPVVEDNFSDMVRRSNPSEWKQTLCIIISYCDSEPNANQYLTELGAKLAKSGNQIAAISCYMCASQLERLFGVWGDLMQENHTPFSQLIEKVFAFTNAPSIRISKDDRTAIAKTYGEYAQFLVNQGHVQVAAEFLKIAQERASTQDIKKLLDRIYVAYPEINPNPAPVQKKQKYTGRANNKPDRYNRRTEPNTRRGHPKSVKDPAAYSPQPVASPRPDLDSQPGRRQTARPAPGRRQTPTRAGRPTGQKRPVVARPGPVTRPPGRTQQPARRQPAPAAEPPAPVRRGAQRPPARGQGTRRGQATSPARNERAPPARKAPMHRNEPVAAPQPEAKPSRRSIQPPRGRQGRTPVRRSDSGRPSGRPAGRSGGRGQGRMPAPVPAMEAPSAQPYGSPTEPNRRSAPRRGPGGYFGQNSSANSYTGNTNKDSRDVLGGLENLVSQLSSSSKISPIDSRSLKSHKSRISQLNGLLSNGQVNPNSYEKLANMVDALLQRDIHTAKAEESSVLNNAASRSAARAWLQTLRTLTKLTEKLLV